MGYKIWYKTFLSRKENCVLQKMFLWKEGVNVAAFDTKCDTKFIFQKMLLRKEFFTKTTLWLLQLNPTYRLQKRILICQQ